MTDCKYSCMKPAATGLLATIFILMICACGCSTRSPEPGQTQAQESGYCVEGRLEGMTWYLVVFHTASGRSADILPGTQITAYLDGSGKMSGSAGCNQYTAPYDGAPDRLTIGDAATTRMSCIAPAGIQSQEATYLSMLQRVSGYRIEGCVLTLLDGHGAPILTFSTMKPASS